MTENFKYVQEHARQLMADYSARNVMCDRMEEFVLMKWADEQKTRRRARNVKVTLDPTPRNRLMGAARLLLASDPHFSIPAEKNPDMAEEVSEKLIEAAAQIWSGAGRVQGRPVHYETVYSLLAFGEVHHYVTSSKDLLATLETADRKGQAEGSEMKRRSKAARKQIENAAAQTPFLIDVGDVRTGYPELGPLGLSAFFHSSKTRAGTVLEKVGKLPPGYDNPFQTCTFNRFWDLDCDYVWLDGMSTPLYEQEHDLPAIPVTVQIGEGTKLTTKYEDQRWPFLYALWRSGLWERQNLTLTVLYTLVAALGFNPQFVNKIGSSGAKATYNFDQPGGIIEVPFDGDFAPLFSKGVIDPSVIQSKQMADELVEASTIYSQTLGEPLSGNAPFAMVSLLHQAGRLPLIVPQRLGSWVIADTVKLCLNWWKEEGIQADYYTGALETLQAQDIPPRYELQADLDVSLPQDELQAAQVAGMVTAGDNPLASQEYARKHFLKIEQSKKMTKAIWDERAAGQVYAAMTQDHIQKLLRASAEAAMQEDAAKKAAMQGQGQGAPPPGGEMAPNQEQAMMQGADTAAGPAPMTPAPTPQAPMAPGQNMEMMQP